MAEHLLRKLASDAGMKDIVIRSAGTAPATWLSFPPHAAVALASEGIDRVDHTPAGLDAAAVEKADLILVMESSHRVEVLSRFPKAEGKVHLLKAYAGLSGPDGIDDPYGRSAEDYKRALQEIKAALDSIIKKWKR